ncbi:MAG: selenium cofactor biosynthesis protein YqeC [Treponema sp.]|nr:selenium cofactor biosynthesis protein YqeC [Treponema sp.]
MTSISSFFENLIFRNDSSELTDTQTRPTVITVIGSGGKTSLIWLLARTMAESSRLSAKKRSILVTPTTKMLPPLASENQYDHFYTGLPVRVEPGITLAGTLNKQTGKLESFPLPELEKIVPEYDLVLIEGDGAGMKPLKGWAEYEPVVPAYTVITAGIIPLWPLGMAVSEEIIHRMPQFCAVSGAQAGENLAPVHISRVINGDTHHRRRSLFSAAQGKRVLFLNHTDNPAQVEYGLEIIKLLTDEIRRDLSEIIIGNIKLNTIEYCTLP